jgi:hypothetical protein
MRRLPSVSALAGALVAALALPVAPPLATPARALSTTTVEFVMGPAGVEDRTLSPQPGSVVTGRWAITVRATSSGGLKRVSLRLQSEDIGVEPAGEQPPPKTYALLSGVLQDEFTVTWDTVATAPRNGTYLWIAEAASHFGEIKTALLGRLLVNNPPQPPGDVAVRLDGTTPVVTWGPAAEPDVIGWRVWRAPAGMEVHEPLATVQTREFRDEGAPPGPQTYEVNAVRRSPVTPHGVPSQLSARTGPVVVPGVVAPPPSPPAPSPPAPSVQGRPQSAGSFDPLLPFATPSAAPATATPSVPPASARPAAAPPRPATDARDRLRLTGAGVLLLAVSLLAWRLRRRLLTGR